MGEIKSDLCGMQIGKEFGSNSDGVIRDSDNYDGGINHIEISHERTRRRNDALTEEQQTIARSELAKLMRIARIVRPGSIYDASAAAQTFSVGGNDRYFGRKRGFPRK